ncbi:MAG: nucleotide-binding protein [Candidatus Zeuxoniibacter abyssi]|nr:MAG: nucleotide-binding protein [Candidatus Persebacteraceae bacterium AB1(2)]
MKNSSKEIFIVHGHDEEMKATTARVISSLGLKPIILHEQLNKGQTTIEKFETNANVQFAIILLSPDDVGRSVKEDELKPRGRQNVILELGYFVGKLGRERVFVLQKNHIEIPTDFSGVVYTPYDTQGRWKMDLVRELQAAGYKADANKII